MEIRNLVKKFVILLLSLLMVACGAGEPTPSVADLPTGDPGNGEKLFNQTINSAPSCASCHNITDVDQTGPGLAGFGQEAGERMAGESAEQYAYNSIVRPARYIVRGFTGLMYAQYGEKLAPEDIADIVAYLLTL